MKVNILIGCVVLLSAINIQAQQPENKVWSLQECIDYAYENNLEIQMRHVNVEKQEVTLNTSQNKRLPDLSANASESFSFGRSTSGFDNTYQDQTVSTSQWSASTSIPIFNGFMTTNEIAASKLDLQAISAELEKAKEDMAINITSTYLQILYYKELLGIADKQVELSREQLDRTKKKYENGRAAEAEIYEIEAQVSNDESSVVQAKSDLQLSILSLTQMLELPSPEGFDVEEPSGVFEFTLIRKPDAIYETALTTRASIRAESLRLESSEKNIKIAQSSYYPSLNFVAGYSNRYYKVINTDSPSFSQQIKNNRNEYLGLNLSIPIFNRFSTRNNVRTAKLNSRLQELQLEDTKKTLYKEIQQAYYNATTSEEKYKSAEAAYKSAEKSFGYMQEKLDNGRATTYEYNDSKTNMIKAQSNSTQAKYDFIFRNKILEFYEKQ